MEKGKKLKINKCLKGIQNRDEKSLILLYDLVAHSIRYIALKYLKKEQDAEDLEQDFWADIYNIADNFKYFKNGFSYICQVMTYMALNRYKKIHGELARTVDVIDYNKIQVFDDNIIVEKLDDKIAVQNALTKLDYQEQVIMQLIIFEDKTIMQIAKELGMSKSQVGRIKKDAQEKLKIELSFYKLGKK